MFVDDLLLELFILGISGFLIACNAYWILIKNKKLDLKGFAVSLVIIGLITLMLSLYNEFTWTLPSSYNILFYDPLTLFSIILLISGFSILFNFELIYSGFIAAFSGIITIIYGLIGFLYGMTNSPIAFFLLYLFFGLAGILGYKISNYFENTKRTNKTIAYVFIILTIVASLIAFVIGLIGLPIHLAHAP